jgi:hypothetical protein
MTCGRAIVLTVPLDVPSQPSRGDDLGQRGAGRDVSEVVNFAFEGPADQQHVDEPGRRGLILDGDLVRGEVPVPFTFAAVPARAAFPHTILGGCEQVVRAQGLTVGIDQGQIDRHREHVGQSPVVAEGAQDRVMAVAGIGDHPSENQ